MIQVPPGDFKAAHDQLRALAARTDGKALTLAAQALFDTARTTDAERNGVIRAVCALSAEWHGSGAFVAFEIVCATWRAGATDGNG